jgi:hypothetical protein
MPPPSGHPSLYLQILPAPFFVTQIRPDEQIPEIFFKRLLANGSSARFMSIGTRNAEEISIVREAGDETDSAEGKPDWRCLKIAGPMEFGMSNQGTGFHQVTVVLKLTLPINRADGNPLRFRDTTEAGRSPDFCYVHLVDGNYYYFRVQRQFFSTGIQITSWCQRTR